MNCKSVNCTRRGSVEDFAYACDKMTYLHRSSVQRRVLNKGNPKAEPRVTEVIYARGHENVQSTHRTTFQITREPFLSKRGDCVIAVAATKGAIDLSSKFKETTRLEKARITVVIEVDKVKEVVQAKGSKRLTFTHPNDLVVRKSSYVCGRTLAINADKAAFELSKELVDKLRDPRKKVKITLIAETVT